MNITVIGAAGRLGQRVVEEASRRGHQVTGLARHRVGDSVAVAAVACGDAGYQLGLCDALGVAGQAGDLVAALGGLLHDPLAEAACGADNRDVHGRVTSFMRPTGSSQPTWYP